MMALSMKIPILGLGLTVPRDDRIRVIKLIEIEHHGKQNKREIDDHQSKKERKKCIVSRSCIAF